MARAATESSPLGAARVVGWARDHGVYVAFAALALFVGGRGLAQVMVGGQLQIISDPSFVALGRAEVLGIPLTVIVAAVLAIAVGFLVQRTTFGRYLLAIG